MLHVQRVSGAGVIHVIAGIVRDEAIVGAVIDAFQRECGAELIAFRRMVIDDVKNDL